MDRQQHGASRQQLSLVDAASIESDCLTAIVPSTTSLCIYGSMAFKVDGWHACGFQHCGDMANDGNCLLTELANTGCIFGERELSTAAEMADR